MRFTIAAVGAFAAVAAAQSSSATKAEVPSVTVSLDPVQSSMYACVDKCPEGDVVCQSHCIAVPAPNEDQVHDTNKCFAKCDQGDGSPEQTERYAACQQKCITEHYFVTSKGTPQSTGAAGSNDSNGSQTTNSASPTNSADGNKDDDKEEAGSKTSTGPAGSKTDEASNEQETPNPDSGAAALAGTSAALFGLIAAVFAL